jgi:hypothetical protein
MMYGWILAITISVNIIGLKLNNNKILIIMDRHEYEINQLINPKKDIVKSNSKHRDNIETLI